MGLDMYLSGKRYLRSYDNQDAEKINEINEALGLGKLSGDIGDDIRAIAVKEVTVEAAYWRKANAIHKWFVDVCQDGVDECQETYVSREQLKQLLDTCRAVLADNSKAETLLPPQSGFFFGGTDIDEWYLGDITFTVDRLQYLLDSEELKDFDFYYQSSW